MYMPDDFPGSPEKQKMEKKMAKMIGVSYETPQKGT